LILLSTVGFLSVIGDPETERQPLAYVDPCHRFQEEQAVSHLHKLVTRQTRHDQSIADVDAELIPSSSASRMTVEPAMEHGPRTRASAGHADVQKLIAIPDRVQAWRLRDLRRWPVGEPKQPPAGEVLEWFSRIGHWSRTWKMTPGDRFSPGSSSVNSSMTSSGAYAA